MTSLTCWLCGTYLGTVVCDVMVQEPGQAGSSTLPPASNTPPHSLQLVNSLLSPHSPTHHSLSHCTLFLHTCLPTAARHLFLLPLLHWWCVKLTILCAFLFLFSLPPPTTLLRRGVDYLCFPTAVIIRQGLNGVCNL